MASMTDSELQLAFIGDGRCMGLGGCVINSVLRAIWICVMLQQMGMSLGERGKWVGALRFHVANEVFIIGVV